MKFVSYVLDQVLWSWAKLEGWNWHFSVESVTFWVGIVTFLLESSHIVARIITILTESLLFRQGRENLVVTKINCVKYTKWKNDDDSTVKWNRHYPVQNWSSGLKSESQPVATLKIVRSSSSSSARLWGCGRDKLLDPISAVLKQEVHFQNIEHMANGCQQPGFHSFYHGKSWNTLDLLHMLCWTVWITTLQIFCCPTRGLFVGMSIQNHAPIRFLNYCIWNDSFTVNRSWPWTSLELKFFEKMLM